MLAILASFIVVAMVEIYAIIQVAHAIGALDTIALLIVVSVVGAWLTKHEGFVVLRRLRAQLDAGRAPTDELIDGVLVLGAGVLLMVPGFVTDAIGLLVLFPPTRALLRRYLRRRFTVRVFGGPAPTTASSTSDRGSVASRAGAAAPGATGASGCASASALGTSPRGPATRSKRSSERLHAGTVGLVDRRVGRGASAPASAASNRRRGSTRPTPPINHVPASGCAVAMISAVPAGTSARPGTDRGRAHQQVGDDELGQHPRVDEPHRLRCDAPAQHRGEVADLGAHRDRGEVDPLGERAIDGAGPPDHRDDLVVARLQRQAAPRAVRRCGRRRAGR